MTCERIALLSDLVESRFQHDNRRAESIRDIFHKRLENLLFLFTRLRARAYCGGIAAGHSRQTIEHHLALRRIGAVGVCVDALLIGLGRTGGNDVGPVSYTHLTLPTTERV